MKILIILVLAFSQTILSKNNQPHIIAILVDDLGWHDLGFHGTDQIKTPNIDALAYSGMILNHHYVLPSCTPSRAALLTGSYPIRSGMQGYPLRGGENRNLPLSFKLKPAHLKDLGYKTHLIGKWHLGYQTYNHVPNNRGFDSFFGYYNGYIDYFNYSYSQPLVSSPEVFVGYDMHLNNDVYRLNHPIYATNLFTERAKTIIREHNVTQPLYLYFSHVATHTGNEDYVGMQADKDCNVNKTYAHIKDYGRRVFAGALEALDTSVGVVVEELRNKGMLENSIILFMSDNGGHTVSTDMAPNWSSNWPLLGTKFTLFEGGVRGAALVWSPLLPKGVVNEGFLHISDWLPTFYSAAGGNVTNLGKLDGVDQWQSLRNVTTVKREGILLNINERNSIEGIIINNRWKLIKGGFPSYGNYEYHWGWEENIAQNPLYKFEDVVHSVAGKAIKSIPGYEELFENKNMRRLREEATVKCDLPKLKLNHADGYVNRSKTRRCPEYCIYDLLNDPCETENIIDDEITQIGLTLLINYRKEMVMQKPSNVDMNSNPFNFNGVWMPWDVDDCAKSKAHDFYFQYVNISVLIIFSWYGFFRKQGYHA